MTAAPQPSPTQQQDPTLDLGFGSVLSRETPRLLNRDGTFNVRREGLSPWERFNFYHYTLTMSWSRFLAIVGASYFLTNAIFALAYVACGPHAVAGITGATAFARFLDAFFFSVETLATIGYGNIVPASFAADVLVTIESLAGLLGFSVIAGLLFSRFRVLLKGFDEPSPQTVHTRSSYKGGEVVWGAWFRSAFNPPRPDGTVSVDIRKLDETDRVPLPAVTRIT